MSDSDTSAGVLAAVAQLVAAVGPPDALAAAAAQARHEHLIKPPGSLGRLEQLGVALASVKGECPPPIPDRPALVIAAGDHGVLAQGVSAWPAEVTSLMVRELCTGRAAASALARVVAVQVTLLDVGVAGELPRHPRLKGSKIRAGTRDLAVEPAMTVEETARALLAGAGVAEQLVEHAGVDMLLLGEVGIGNTTPAACLTAAFTGLPAERVTGPGAGAGGDVAALERKTGVVACALELHAGVLGGDPLATLAALGGLEHAALVGVILAGAAARVPVLLDGVSTVAAALVAAALAPDAVACMIAGHRSAEPGAAAGLEQLGLEPLLDLSMRLGEGTGALLAVPLVQAAAAALGEMATFEDAGIAQ